MSVDNSSSPKPSKVEEIKAESDFLRGTILEGLADASTGAIAPDDTQLSKFHGIYQQDDRDVRKQGKKYMFMIRGRIPGGVVSPDLYLTYDRLSED